MKGCDNEICDSYVEIYLMESSSINCSAIILEEHSFIVNLTTAFYYLYIQIYVHTNQSLFCFTYKVPSALHHNGDLIKTCGP